MIKIDEAFCSVSYLSNASSYLDPTSLDPLTANPSKQAFMILDNAYTKVHFQCMKD
jgi:hypothetical protein